MWWYRQLSVNLFFCDALRIICNNGSKCSSIIKKKKHGKQPAKYLHLVIAPLGILHEQWMLEIEEDKFLKWKPEKRKTDK